MPCCQETPTGLFSKWMTCPLQPVTSVPTLPTQHQLDWPSIQIVTVESWGTPSVYPSPRAGLTQNHFIVQFSATQELEVSVLYRVWEWDALDEAELVLQSDDFLFCRTSYPSGKIHTDLQIKGNRCFIRSPQFIWLGLYKWSWIPLYSVGLWCSVSET